MRLKNDLLPFARDQRMDELVCHVIIKGELESVCTMHYSLGNPKYYDIVNEYKSFTDWYCEALKESRKSNG
jgi:hypothetical protein